MKWNEMGWMDEMEWMNEGTNKGMNQ